MSFRYNPLLSLGIDYTSGGGAAGPGYVGSFADLTALTTAFPTSADGAFAFVQDTDTFYAWDTTGSAWVQVGSPYYVQSVISASTVNVAHNLGRYPTVIFVETGGDLYDDLQINHTDVNNFTVSWNGLKTGDIVCN